MGFAFNPFTGNFDAKGSGGSGSSYLDGEVQNFSALPETLGSPAVDSAYLVREAEGTWLLNRKPAGIYIRTANTGTRASDWTYAGEFPDVFNDANFVLYDNGDSTKNLQFQLSGIATGTTRTITAPDKNVTLDDAGDSRNPTAHAASHLGGIRAWIVATDEDLSGITEIVSIRADNAGTAGNSITISFDGVDNVSAAVATWNAANPSNTATVLQGGSQIPDNGQSVTLTHGANAAADPIVAANLDSLLVAGTDTGGGEFADIRLKGKTFFGNASGNTGMLAEGNAPFHPPSTFGFTGVNESVTAYRPLGFTTGYYAQLVLNTDGKVGVGTSTPAEKLDVNGAIQASELKLSDNSNTQIATFVADANLTAARTYDLPDRSGELMLVGDAPASHTHGNITNDGLVGTTAGLPLKTGTGGIVEAGAFGVNAGEFAEGNHTHTQLHDKSHTMTDVTSHTAGNHKVFYSNGSGEIVELALGNSGEVLTSNGASAAPSFAAASGGGVTTGSVDNAIIRADGTGGSTSQSSDIVIDDATTSTQANVAIVNVHSETNSSIVLTPKGTGALIFGPKPDGVATVGGNARGTRAIDLQTSRGLAAQVASGTDSVALGAGNTASSTGCVAIGQSNTASGNVGATAIGRSNTASARGSVAIGFGASMARTGGMAFTCNESGAAGQATTFVMRGTTTTNSAVELATGPDGTRITIPSGVVVGMLIQIVGASSTGATVAHFVRQYAVKNVGGTTSEVYAPVTIGTDNAASTSISITADDAGDRLKIECTGLAATTIKWTARVECLEINY